jgi:hypothetical protein
MSKHRWWMTLSLLALACGGKSHVAERPSNRANSGGFGAASAGDAGAGGGAVSAGSGATAGSGASGGMAAGNGAIGGATAGRAATAGNGAMTNGGSAGASVGGAGAGSSGTGGSSAGNAAVGAGAGGMGEPHQVTDENAVGEGPCASTTVAEVISAVHAQWPELADVSSLSDPNLSSPNASVTAFSSNEGYRLAFFRGFGDCPSGCISREYFYFETNDRCEPVAVGSYHLIYSGAHNCYYVVGDPLWGIPSPSAENGSCAETKLPPGFNEDCLENECPVGLTPAIYVPVSGSEQACLCSIPCANDPSACPAGTNCESPPDTPANICY